MTEREPVNSLAVLKIEQEESYSLENIFFRISDVRYPCCHQNKACNECAVYGNQKSWRITTVPSCIEIIKNRDDHMFYLADRIYRSVVNDKYELWTQYLDKVLPYPVHSVESKATEFQIKDWIKSAYILRPDLETFCDDIRLNVSFNRGNEIDNEEIAAHVETHEAEPSELRSNRVETPTERKSRLCDRMNELKSQGLRNFRQRVAEEEGVTPARITQIVSDNKSKKRLSKY